MLSHILILLVSLLFLAKGADWFVELSARVARRLGVSDLMVGLTVTSIGTSIPELASSVSASVQNHTELVVGSIVGSNIANIGLILGTAAAIRPFATEHRMHYRDGFVLLTSAAVFFGTALDNRLDRFEAAGFLLIYLAYITFAARTDREGVEVRFSNFIDFFFRFEYARPRSLKGLRGLSSGGDGSRLRILRELGGVILSCGLVILSAHYLVREAVWLAGLLKIPESLVGLSLIAVGTSLPELVVAVVAARKTMGNMVVGNVTGSNIANTLLVLGVCGLIRPLDIPESSVTQTIPVMIFFSLGLVFLVRSGWRVTRPQGLLALTCYLAFIAFSFVQGAG